MGCADRRPRSLLLSWVSKRCRSGSGDARIVTGGVLVSTGVSKQRGACRGACPR